MRRAVLAVDIGTSVVKAAVFDGTGAALRVARAEPPLLDVGAGRSEIDMEALWAVVARLIRDTAAGGDFAIEALALSGTSCGAWLVDAAGRPVRPAILWNDGRAARTIAEWQRAGVLDAIFARSGNVLFPGYTVAVLRWLKEHEPASLAAAAAVVCCKDFVRLRLTGRLATDPSDASYVPFDIAAGRFSPEIFDLCGIGDLVPLLPEIVESGAVAGTLQAQSAALLGLPSGIPVVTGMTDVAATTLGAGALHPGTACTILGTSCLNTLVLAEPMLTGPAVGIAARTVGPTFLRSMVNTAGTLNLDWFLREIWPSTAGDPFAAFEVAAAAVPIGARGLLYHPYLNTTGVLSPFVHPHARAQFFGLSVEHGRADIGRAVLEGVAFAIRDCFAAMPEMPGRLRLTGGGSRSRLWCAIIADCLGVPVDVPLAPEPGAYGVAMLALVATGLAPDLTHLADAVAIEATYEPDRGREARYSELFALYRSVAAHSIENWTLRARLGGDARGPGAS